MPFNSIFSWVIKKRVQQIEYFKENPILVQEELLIQLIQSASFTEYGQIYRFDRIQDYSAFRNQVPLIEYQQLKPFVDRMMNGEQNLLCSMDVKWFAKSSGTTAARSKFIPVTPDALFDCHYKGGKDLLAMYYTSHPKRKLYNGKHLIVGGSTELLSLNADAYSGDLSAIIVKNLPWWAELRRTPSRDIAMMPNWEEKVIKMAESTAKQDVYILAGVPSWTLVLARKVLEITGKRNLKEVWPNLELFMHGGVNFAPYKQAFQELIPDPSMNYVETYNASEGFFGIQDEVGSSEMLLMLDYGIFYEFIPMETFDGVNSKEIHSLAEVKKGVNYAMVITTNAGLWRYIIGDTIQFTNLKPFRFRITGRTRSFINAFGEELIVEQAEDAVAYASAKQNCFVKEYTVAPRFDDGNGSGCHEWVIEFLKPPENLNAFLLDLDERLKELNSDYDAKRVNSLVLQLPRIHQLLEGAFDNWLKKSGKLGGQHKIPRLSNDRTFLDQLLTDVGI